MVDSKCWIWICGFLVDSVVERMQRGHMRVRDDDMRGISYRGLAQMGVGGSLDPVWTAMVWSESTCLITLLCPTIPTLRRKSAASSAAIITVTVNNALSIQNKFQELTHKGKRSGSPLRILVPHELCRHGRVGPAGVYSHAELRRLPIDYGVEDYRGYS